MDYFERPESDFKKGPSRIRGLSDEKLKSLDFEGISLKLGPVGIFDIRTIFGVSADFRALRRISVFSDLA